MRKTLGYMLTWRTYGTWLQGDPHSFVKDGVFREGEDGLRTANVNAMKGGIVELSKKQRRSVHEAITGEASRLGQKVHALAVRQNHVHVVLGYTEKSISEIVSRYKNAGRMALKGCGFVGRMWAKGYDKRYCFDEASLRERIQYVQEHGR